MRRVTLLAIGLAVVLGACAKGSDGPALAVEGYLQALASKDGDRLTTLSCSDWEQTAQTELDSFQAVDVKLQDAACATTGTEGDTTLVGCQGKLIATYGGENQELDLSTRTYQVVQQSGEWLVCGER